MQRKWAAAGLMAALTATAPPPAPDSQAIVGPTGSMYNGNNIALAAPDDGSIAMQAAIASGTASKAAIPAQNPDKSSVSRSGGGN